jgi:hypothetical protein
LRHTLNELARVHPNWLRPLIELDWLERYSKRVDEYHLPKSQQARQVLAEAIGADGLKLVEAAQVSELAEDLAASAALQCLRHIWEQEFHWEGERLRWRADNEYLASMHLIVNVKTSLATSPDQNTLPSIHQCLEQHKLLRQEQETEAWKTLYQQQAGIEGTISQSLRVTGL